MLVTTSLLKTFSGPILLVDPFKQINYTSTPYLVVKARLPHAAMLVFNPLVI